MRRLKIEVIVKKSLVISDLNYCQLIDDNTVVLGGYVYADTVTATKTGRGYAIADAGAVAIGETTYTNAITKTNAKKRGSLTSSTADAIALAYAQTGNQIALSLSRNTSISRYVTNR